MRYLLLALGIFAGDYAIKEHVEKNWKEGRKGEILGGKILLSRTHNRGMAMNLGENRQPLVAAFSLALTVFFTVLLLGLPGRKGAAGLKTGLALVLGGAYSNTYDRIRRKYVVDYFSFGVKNPRLRRIVFNLADFAIAIGALAVVLTSEWE